MASASNNSYERRELEFVICVSNRVWCDPTTAAKVMARHFGSLKDRLVDWKGTIVGSTIFRCGQYWDIAPLAFDLKFLVFQVVKEGQVHRLCPVLDPILRRKAIWFHNCPSLPAASL